MLIFVVEKIQILNHVNSTHHIYIIIITINCGIYYNKSNMKLLYGWNNNILFVVSEKVK